MPDFYRTVYWFPAVKNTVCQCAALLIAVLDILPVLGKEAVLIPWGIIHIMTGNYSLAAGIFLLYLAITVIRNIVEPKLIGKQMELHPVVTLASMLDRLKIFWYMGTFWISHWNFFFKEAEPEWDGTYF